MAEFLQREFSLPVLKVRLSTEERTPLVDCELVVNYDGGQDVVEKDVWPLAEFGFSMSESLREEPDLYVPAGLRAWVGDWVNGTLGPDAVLWLHLVKPYGHLGAVPWERDIQPVGTIPLLRLPDVLPEAERSPSSFRMALCATAPAQDGSLTAAQMGPEVATRIAEGIGPRLDMHVFGDLEAKDLLEAELAHLPGVTVHSPQPDFDDEWESAAQQTDERRRSGTTGEAQNRWLWWIRKAMGKRSLDAVHFICHGVSLREDGAMLTPWSPTDVYRDSPQYVTASELGRFVTAVGALIVGFTAPFDNYSDFGLRRLADELGARRAGPVLLQDPRIDTGGLTETYRFLTAPDPAQPPASNNLMIYAQPHRVGGQYEPAVPELEDVPETLESSAAVKEHFERDETPTWLAAAERYLDEQQAELLRFEKSKREGAPTKTQEEYYAGLGEALVDLRALVDDHAEKSL